MKIPRLPVLGLLLGTLLFSPSLSAFYTHDDFFHFSISRAASPAEFINFFNLLSPPSGFGWYRPLTTQVFYWLGIYLFDLQPLPMRLMLFANYFLVVFLVWLLAKKITGSKKIAGYSAFLYAVSASHYAHLYFFSVQELGLGLFYFLSLLFYLNFLSSKRPRLYFFSLAAFILALACKEWAVTLPFIMVMTGWYVLKPNGGSGIKTVFLSVIPHLLLLAGYFLLRIGFYGFARGDSYVWDISPRIINTLSWYGLWSLNIPEMFIDFIGPGLHLNPNLLRFWGRETLLIAGLFLALAAQLIRLVWKNSRNGALDPQRRRLLLLCAVWFIATLGPVMFLPWHKFAFYLTIPLFGVVVFISALISWSGDTRLPGKIFLLNFFLLSVVTLSLTVRTHWISKGQETAARVDRFVRANISSWPYGTTLVLYDTPADSDLPWSPAQTVKTVLSDNNYFQVFTDRKVSAEYLPALPDKISSDRVLVPARQFLGY